MTGRFALATVALLLIASPAGAQGLSKLQSAGLPSVSADPSAIAAVAGGTPAAAAPPTTLPPVYQLLDAPRCEEFKRVDTGWSAQGPIQFPGPRGPIKMIAGQTVAPGGYLDGLDLGAVLQRDCSGLIVRAPDTLDTPR